jgi:hypothetical protein
MLRKMLGAIKDAVRIEDEIKVTGASSTRRGIRMSDGSKVPVEQIMGAFGVSREQAEVISARRSR